jgi:MSHA biogenesis protein MshI
MRWPWKRTTSRDLLVVSWSGKTFAFVRARASGAGVFEVLQLGVERQGEDSMDDFVRRLQALGLKGMTAHAMLQPEQYQLLQIDAPAVPPEEMRPAARFQIREMVQSHIDDITLDVMRVGDGEQKGQAHLFVVAVTNAVIREFTTLADAMHWTLPVIDIQETAQRNLQSALVAKSGKADRANAALVVVDGHQAVLTISAHEELFYTRRLELPEGFMAMTWSDSADVVASADDGYTPVGEYVPDYSVGGVSAGADYSAITTTGSSQAGNERVQRFVVEVQRSLDLWDRSWSHMPLGGLTVFAGERSAEMATWLARETGQTFTAMEVDAFFPGLQAMPAADRALCFALLGVLMRTESRKL